MKISRETLRQLIENKLCQAGLKREHAATVAEVLVYADARGSTLMARCAWNTTRNAFQKAAPTVNRNFVLKKPGRVRQFYMPTMLPDRSRRKWVWNMPSKPPSKMALRWSVSAGWVTAAQSLILCSRQPAQD